MLPEYNKEVDDFLQNVNSLTEDNILARVNSETSEEDVDGKVLDEITEVFGIVVDAATAKKAIESIPLEGSRSSRRTNGMYRYIFVVVLLSARWLQVHEIR